MKIINKNDLPFATDYEANQRRAELIRAGIIKEPSRTDLVEKADGVAVSTIKYSKNLRRKLVKSKIISNNYVPVPSLGIKSTKNNEEGEFKVKPITTNSQYLRVRNLYFRALQEILISRKELNLILLPKPENAPEWMF